MAKAIKAITALDDAAIQRLADEAERGYDVDQIIARRRTGGRPSLGESPSVVTPVRLDPAVKRELGIYAREHQISLSEAVRRAVSDMLSRK